MVDVRLVKHSDAVEQLVELFHLCFDDEMSPDAWDWKYRRNPSAPPGDEVIVALDGGRIVGARPFMFADMWLGNERVRAAQHCDTMVHPEHRSQGIFGRMGRLSLQWLRENGCALSYGFPGPMSRPGFLSQGYRVAAETEVLFRPVNPARLLSQKLGNRPLAAGLGFLCGKLIEAGAVGTRRAGAFEVEVFDRFADELGAVDGLRDESAITLVRSESCLRWRFDDSPRHDYKYVVARAGDKLRGYAVVSVQKQPDGLVYGLIVDYLVKDGDPACFSALMERCLVELGRSDHDITMVWAFSEPGLREELLRGLGFKSSLRFPYRRFFQYSYMDALRLDERVGRDVDVYDAASWRVTHAFSDMR
jgi:GNAT superfamily N-acetyltransferase